MTNKDCLFCKIINNDINADKIYEDDYVLAFNDISAQAPNHFLVIPKKHIATINDADDKADEAILGKMMLAAKKIIKSLGEDENGFRLVMNCNENGGQSVYHIHLHCLAGRKLSWPPG